MGRLNTYFCGVGGPTMVGSDATEYFSNVTPLRLALKDICQTNILLISIVFNRGSAKNPE